MESRANALPIDYQIVYGEMKSYLWRFTAGDGMDIVAILKEVLRLFETSAAQGKSVLDVTRERCRRVLRRALARHDVEGRQVAVLAQPRRGQEARRIGPC